MIALTLKERRLLEHAVYHFGDEPCRELWRDWRGKHPGVRVSPDDPHDDGTGLMDRESKIAFRLVLQEYAADVAEQIANGNEEEASALSNDLADINSLMLELLRA